MSTCALFVGLGGVGQRHLRNLRELLGDQLRPIAYRVRRENDVLTDRLGIKDGGNLERDFGLVVHHDLDAALAERPAICIIANPSALHVPVALRAIEGGADVFIEKPLSSSLDDVQNLINSSERAGRIGYVAYQLRFHPAVQALCRAMDEELVGTIYGAAAEVAEYLPAFHPYEDYRRMYASRSDLGGGVILTQIHEVDLLYRLFGTPDRVFSEGGKISNLEIDVEDSATSVLSFRRADGARWAASLHQDYLGRPPRRSLRIWGSRGNLDLNLRAGTLDFVDTEGDIRRIVDAQDHPRNQLFIDELQHFLDCVRMRTSPCVTLADGAETLRIALGLKSSLRSGLPVRLQET